MTEASKFETLEIETIKSEFPLDKITCIKCFKGNMQSTGKFELKDGTYIDYKECDNCGNVLKVIYSQDCIIQYSILDRTIVYPNKD